MENLVLFRRSELRALADTLRNVVEGIEDGTISQVRFAIHEGGLKIKGNDWAWSPPMGQMERSSAVLDRYGFCKGCGKEYNVLGLCTSHSLCGVCHSTSDLNYG